MAFTAYNPETGADILVYSFETGDIQVYLKTEYDEQTPMFSPDGRGLAYASDESGEYEIYVTSYPGPGGKWQVSRGGGVRPMWSADGRELFYIAGDKLMSVTVENDGGFRFATPVTLFKRPEMFTMDAGQIYDVAPDGRRFLFLTPLEDDGVVAATVTLLQGWRALLQ